MENILVIISEHDIPIAETVAPDLDGYKVYFFDPTLVDLIHASALRNAELITWDDCPDYPALVEGAHADAFALERELDQSVRALLPAECSLEGWQHLNLYYLFSSYRWYSALWPAVLSRLKDGKPHVFLCDNPSNYYWPSFLPALLLLQQLRTWSIPFSAVTYGARPDESDVLINLCQGAPEAQRYDVLTHLPTCFYDVDYFNAELRAAGKSSINILPKYWGGVSEASAQVGLIRRGDQQLLCAGQPALDAIGALLTERLDALLTPCIATASYRARQVDSLCSLYQSQLASLFLLEQYFEQHRPGKMLLSDHDAGFHGPLLSFAERHRIPVLMVPHAKTSDNTEFGYDGITMLTHPMQGGALVNGKQKRVLHFTLAYPERFAGASAAPAGLKRIGLLLNGLSLNGVLCTDMARYMEGIGQIAKWCDARGIELAIRCRPGQSLFEMLNQAIGVERAALLAALACPLPSYAESCDLCLMYDAPTNADIEFLRIGVPILNPVPAPLTKAEAATANTAIVPRQSVAATLELLDNFVADDNHLHAFRTRQFADYVSLFKRAYALRRLL